MPALLVNNAARFDYDTPDTVRQGGLIDHYAVNCAAPVLLARALAATAAADRPAAIVNILDQRIAAPNADQFSYATASEPETRNDFVEYQQGAVLPGDITQLLEKFAALEQ